MVIQTLKEAYRYQNFLTSLIREARSYLMDTNFVTKKTQTHNRSKFNSDAQDEVVEVAKNRNVTFTPSQVINFYVAAIEEKERLNAAIDLAKSKATAHDDGGKNVDSSLAINKTKHEFMNVLGILAGIKPAEQKVKGIGYKFNNDGEQVTYYYDIDEVISIDFDRNNVRKLMKKYQEETDKVSDWIDGVEITDYIAFIPEWDITDSFEDIVSTF